jgi:hypothetical protein
MKNYKSFKIVVNLILALLSMVFYIFSFIYFLKFIEKAIPCESAYNIGKQIHCPEYLWTIMVFLGFYFLFMSVVSVVFKYFFKSFSSFLSMALLPTIYIVVIQVFLIIEAIDLNNIGPDQIRANDLNEIYLFVSIFTLLFIGMVIFLWNWMGGGSYGHDRM